MTDTCPRARAMYLRRELDALPRIEGPDYMASRARHRAAVEALHIRLAALPDQPRIRDAWNGARVTMLGITATSTSGLHQALHNWCTRALGPAPLPPRAPITNGVE